MSVERMTRRWLAALLSLLLSAAAVHGADKRVVLGQVGLSFYAVVGGVVQEVLESQGFAVEVVEGAHAEIFPKLGAGEVDILAAAWLPGGHQKLFDPVRGVTFQIAPIYDDARFFWVVPSYVPQELVSSVEDLKRTEVAARMAKRIVSLPEVTTGGRRVMAAYKLDEAGYELIAGQPGEWIETFRSAVEKKEWIIFPLWQPHWVNAAYDVRALGEPKNAYGDPDTAWLIGHQSLKDKLDPKTLGVLQRLQLSVAAVTQMDRAVNVEKITPREAARRWLAANPAIVQSWRQAAP